MAKSRKKEGINLFAIVFVIIIIVAIATIAINMNKDKENKNNVNTVQQGEQISGESQEGQQEEQQNEKYVQILEDGTKVNTSPKLSENRKLDNLEIEDIQLVCRNSVTTLLATVQNRTNQKTERTDVEIKLVDENGETKYTLQGIIQEIEPGENVKLNCSITVDFANAYDFEITKK